MSFTPRRIGQAEVPESADTPEAASPTPADDERAGWARALSIAATFAALIALAVWLRGAAIWPQGTGLDESPYDDEGVYAAAAQLLRQGKHPYRDYIYAHPPLGPVLLAPAIDVRFSTWGSPTTFMALRYLSVAYSALTVGFVFLIGWRLWGYAGGAFGAALLAIDPLSVWAGRHVMLESPLLCLAALAALAYVLAREEAQPPPALLLLAGFFAAAAGGVKLQGLVVIVAMAFDLLIRRRGVPLAILLTGAFALWLPLWAYLLWLNDGDPLGQFVVLQLLRPGDGIVSLADRAVALWSGNGEVGLQASGGWLLLAAAVLALAALPALLLRPVRRVRRQPRRVSAPGGPELPRLTLDGAVEEPPPPRQRRTIPTVPRATPRATLFYPSGGWTLLLPWLGLAIVVLAAGRSFYDHYGAQLALPLAILAGALPLAIGHAARVGWGGRVAGLALAGAACALLVWLAPGAWGAATARREDRLYTIVGRYATDAVPPEGGIFALDAQFPFRAARRPAREDRDRFVVDSYGMLLYHGLGIERMGFNERLRRSLTERPGRDPYAVMWRPAPQAQLRASIERADLAIIDRVSDGRLSAETRQWLATRGVLAERQDRYVIYRIRR